MIKQSHQIKRKVSTVAEIDALIAELQQLKQRMQGDSALSEQETLVLNKIKAGVYQKDLKDVPNITQILAKLRPLYLTIGDKQGTRLILK